MQATIYKSTGSWYIAKTSSGKLFNARIKGALKIEGITSTNPIAVGDIVHLEIENELENTATITTICDRQNYINRQSPSHKMQHHIIAANVDQSLLFATLKEPKTSQGFIDRFLITCEAFHIPAIIVMNKIDVYKKKEEEKLIALTAMYQAIGYTVLPTSIKTKTGLEAVSRSLNNKITLLSGHSGVGKSSFINSLFPHIHLKTQAVSGFSGKGLHTTTFAEMFDVQDGTTIIDTPGIREFGLVDISKQELSHYFPEMKKLLSQCQFNNCLHINEPGCAIKDAVAAGSIHEDRYMSYYNIFEKLEEKKY
jgi:ribosome biogenesis GTPase / thiamine phosphate phosphatase